MPGHDDHGSQRDLVGYGPCSTCQVPTRDEVLHVTGGLCEADWLASRGERKVISVMKAGQRFEIALEPDSPKTARNRRKAERRKTDAAFRRRKHRLQKARLRADRRLRQLFPEIHAVLLAEERARDGFEPFPVQTTVGRPAPDDFAEVYHQLTSEGIQI